LSVAKACENPAHRKFELINPSKSRHVSPRGGFLF